MLGAAGKSAEAITSFRSAAAAIERLPKPEAVDVYNLACIQALSARTAGASGAGEWAAEGRTWADRAMKTLCLAVAAGYRDVVHMQADTDLDPLRGRPDFQLLMMDLAFPADPFTRR